jgi:hypothetical protein
VKAKIQIVVGLITAIVSVAGVLVLFTQFLIYHLTQRAPCAPYTIYPLGSILPAIYGIFLIRKKLRQVRLIFWVWLISWIITLVFMFLDDIVYYRWLQQSLPDKLYVINFYLWVAVGLPSFAFLQFLYPIVDIFNVSSFTWRAITGVIVMVLLWIGVKGLEQIKQTKNPVTNEEVITPPEY